MINCGHCDGIGLLNVEQLSDDETRLLDDIGPEAFLDGGHIPADSDVCVCDCCGDGKAGWHGQPGYHYGPDDPPGLGGPYAYNGGLCECH